MVRAIEDSHYENQIDLQVTLCLGARNIIVRGDRIDEIGYVFQFQFDIDSICDCYD